VPRIRYRAGSEQIHVATQPAADPMRLDGIVARECEPILNASGQGDPRDSLLRARRLDEHRRLQAGKHRPVSARLTFSPQRQINKQFVYELNVYAAHRSSGLPASWSSAAVLVGSERVQAGSRGISRHGGRVQPRPPAKQLGF
jgi:hypothetical protein